MNDELSLVSETCLIFWKGEERRDQSSVDKTVNAKFGRAEAPRRERET